MSFQLSFRERHRYEKSESGLAVRTILSAGQRTVNCVATIDTGAAVCLFQRELAELLDLDLESGHQITLSTLTGSLPAWGTKSRFKPSTLPSPPRSTSPQPLA